MSTHDDSPVTIFYWFLVFLDILGELIVVDIVQVHLVRSTWIALEDSFPLEQVKIKRILPSPCERLGFIKVSVAFL